jgi:universal stress protein E
MHREALHKFAGKHSIPAERLHLREGAPDEVIAQFAREIAADLVVMGTVNRTGLVRVVIGSTAERILDQLNCDVLALKPAGFVSDLEQELLPRSEEASID